MSAGTVLLAAVAGPGEAASWSFELPTIPVGIVVLLGFFAPYGVALAIRPEWPARAKKLASLVASLLVAAVTLILAVLLGYQITSWPVFVLIAIMTVSASYALITKGSADRLARDAGNGSHSA